MPLFTLLPRSAPSPASYGHLPRRLTSRKAAAAASFSEERYAVRRAVVAEYKKGKSTVRGLAEKYGMSTSAVQRLVSGESTPTSKRGRQTILPPEVEKDIVSALVRCGRAYVGLSPNPERKEHAGEDTYARRYNKKARHE